jgi:hypothetical protein
MAWRDSSRNVTCPLTDHTFLGTIHMVSKRSSFTVLCRKLTYGIIRYHRHVSHCTAECVYCQSHGDPLHNSGVLYAHLRQKVRHISRLSINYQPHTILATGFSKEFPGIKPHLLTLSTNFRIPIYRDILLALGICSVSKKSCANILKAGPGYAITIVVGGAAESLSARPGTADLTLRRRWVIGLYSRSI